MYQVDLVQWKHLSLVKCTTFPYFFSPVNNCFAGGYRLSRGLLVVELETLASTTVTFRYCSCSSTGRAAAVGSEQQRQWGSRGAAQQREQQARRARARPRCSMHTHGRRKGAATSCTGRATGAAATQMQAATAL